MTSTDNSGSVLSVDEALKQLNQAAERGEVTAPAVENIKRWLLEPRYADYRDRIVQHIADQKWQKLDDVFWTVIPFGTGGRRGRMYEFGSNAINERTIGESAQGLANYVREQLGSDAKLSCAIAYDTRHRSREFAELCAGVMVAAGFKVYFLDEYRATPQLSFAVRSKDCSCGIMVTASHNPPSDNAVKVYWSSGGQVLPPHDKEIVARVMECDAIEKIDFNTALAEGKVEICTDEIDAAYQDAAYACQLGGPRDVKVLYSPLHGVGAYATIPLLKRDGFKDVEVYEPHAEPSGDFPNVPGHVSNPENKAVFDKPIEYARANGFDMVLATDPDADRVGVAAPLTSDSQGEWDTLTGNQIGAILEEFILSRRKAAGTLSPEHYVVTTLVTTALIGKIAKQYGVGCESNLLVGFKWIAGIIDRDGPDKFVFGTEESHGYLVGQYARDKDAPVACMLLCELAAQLKADGQSLHEYLAAIYQRHGYHNEHLINVVMEGSEGMANMKKLMATFRSDPPKQLGGMKVTQVRDYANLQILPAGGGTPMKLDGPVGDLVILDLEQSGNYVAVRPSGTEPKVKFYIFTCLPPAESQDVAAAKEVLSKRNHELIRDVESYSAKI
ncbi:Phosphoglucomutase [Roseimaritima multifibrata]|uniref:Phosphoglucomutase n=1 Tax=Roseimaritima multifibrata TaxID=1930274 RepID=A0A517MAX7_9BACT|nr:phospho-sugar mutase [Roseimaritima multifibrata]QDS92040.1 Phosphoglucomutase [Roseimaritima multifibrata]